LLQNIRILGKYLLQVAGAGFMKTYMEKYGFI
jgi:hypothetical protein